MSVKPGCLITLEGIEGMGKSTSLSTIKKYLAQAHIDVVTTREPGGTSVAEAIRQVLIAELKEPILPVTEVLLLFAGRAQHIAQVIKPALEKGQWVVCDRFTDASYAYQGSGRGIPMRYIRMLEMWIQGRLHPQLTLLLDAPVKVGLKRVHRRADPDRIESETLKFFERVRQGYRTRAKRYPGRYRIIKAARSPRQMKEEILQVLKQFLIAQGILTT